nr:tyrosine-protein phosphatase [Lachnospiraceae bacterium]
GGQSIRPGKLIRCGHLSELSDKDKGDLISLVDTIIDLRSYSEYNKQPDIMLEGITYHHLPIVDDLTAGITREKESDKELYLRFMNSPTDAKEYMCGMYRDFALNKTAGENYSAFVKILLKSHNKAVLWHCTAGKDRAGIAALIIEEILGVSKEDIINDYLMTNTYLKKDIEFLNEYIKKQAGIPDDAPKATEALKYLFGAEKEYIDAFYDTVRETFGSFEEYIENELCISNEEVMKLREMYLQ